MEKQPIKVLIAEDTEVGRRGLKDMLDTADDIRMVGESDSIHTIARRIQDLSPDLLLMDLKWYDDETAGWIKIRELKREFPNLKVIAITAYPNLTTDAWKAGADQVVTKSLRLDELLDLIRTVHRHKAAPRLEESGSAAQHQLSRRELEVLSLVDKGLSDKEISQALGIEVNTTKNHVKNILQKLDAENRRKAARIAREQGILK